MILLRHAECRLMVDVERDACLYEYSDRSVFRRLTSFLSLLGVGIATRVLVGSHSAGVGGGKSLIRGLQTGKYTVPVFWAYRSAHD